MKKLIGLTLIELMISLLLSALIISCLITLYLSIEKNQDIQFALTTIEENATLATNLLGEAIQQAGYVGCQKLTNQVSNKTEIELTEKNKLSVKSAEFTVRHASLQSVVLEKNMRGNSTLYVSDQFKINKNDILMISDCKTIDIFKVKESEISGDIQKIITEFPLENLYEKNTNVRRLEVNTYFIDNTERKDQRNNDVYALYLKNSDGQKEELVEGINEMRVKKKGDGISIELILASLNQYALQKQWFLYAEKK